MSEEQAEYKTQQTAIQHKLAAMFAANKDEVSVPKIYIDMTGDYHAACVLDELMFWTLPKKNGKTSLRVFRNGYLWLAVRRSDWWDRKRITERQSDRGIDKLIALDLVEKEVFLFDGKPTVHLRMKMQAFVKTYGEAIAAIAAGENDENLARDLSDLYQMMGFPIHQTVISILPNGEMLNLPNGEIINSPVQPLNTPIGANAPDNSEKQAVIDKANRKMDAFLALSQAPGIKYEARINDILSYLGVTFRRNVETKEWRAFAKYIDSEYQSKGWDVKRFISWLFGQKGYDPNYWPVKKMMEFYPSAFAVEKNESPTYKPLPEDTNAYVPNPNRRTS